MPFNNFFHLLFPSPHEAVDFLYRIGVKGCGDQRHFDLSVAFDWRSRQPLVGHAHYGAPCCDFCCSHDDTIYKTVIKKRGCKKRDAFYSPSKMPVGIPGFLMEF